LILPPIESFPLIVFTLSIADFYADGNVTFPQAKRSFTSRTAKHERALPALVKVSPPAAAGAKLRFALTSRFAARPVNLRLTRRQRVWGLRLFVYLGGRWALRIQQEDLKPSLVSYMAHSCHFPARETFIYVKNCET
jgi:hypothetical protein